MIGRWTGLNERKQGLDGLVHGKFPPLVIELTSGTMSLVTVYLIYWVSSIGFADLLGAGGAFLPPTYQLPCY